MTKGKSDKEFYLWLKETKTEELFLWQKETKTEVLYLWQKEAEKLFQKETNT